MEPEPLIDLNNNEVGSLVDVNNNNVEPCPDFNQNVGPRPDLRQEPARIPPLVDVELIYSRLIEEAPYVPGEVTDDPSGLYPEIDWMNPALIVRGQAFVRANFFSLICAHLGALLYGFSFKNLSTVLLRTGHSSDIRGSVVRYLSTFQHLKTWYESDLTGAAEDGYRDVMRIKKMHVLALRKYRSLDHTPPSLLQGWTLEKQEIVEALQKDLRVIPITAAPAHLLTYTPVLPMSQFDMVMTQFGVISLVYLFPGTLGIQDKAGMDGFLHLWAVVGKILGIQDRFNLALYPSRELYLRIFRNIGVYSLQESDLTVVSLQKNLIDGVAKYAYFTSVKSLLYYGLTMNDALEGFQGTHLARIMSLEDKAYYWLMRVLLWSVHRFQVVRSGVNVTARVVLALASRKYLRRRKGKVAKPNLLAGFVDYTKGLFRLKRLNHYYHSSSIIYNAIIFTLYSTFCLISLLIVCIRF